MTVFNISDFGLLLGFARWFDGGKGDRWSRNIAGLTHAIDAAPSCSPQILEAFAKPVSVGQYFRLFSLISHLPSSLDQQDSQAVLTTTADLSEMALEYLDPINAHYHTDLYYFTCDDIMSIGTLVGLETHLQPIKQFIASNQRMFGRTAPFYNHTIQTKSRTLALIRMMRNNCFSIAEPIPFLKMMIQLYRIGITHRLNIINNCSQPQQYMEALDFINQRKRHHAHQPQPPGNPTICLRRAS